MDTTTNAPGANYTVQGTGISMAVYRSYAVMLTISGIVATMGNITVIVVFARSKVLRHKMHNYMIFSLAVSDLGLSVFGFPFVVPSLYLGRWQFSDAYCQTYGFACFTLSMTSLCSLVVLSVYRYVYICRPDRSATHLNYRTTAGVIFGCWLMGPVYAIWPFVGLSTYKLEPSGVSCSLDWDTSDTGSKAYTILLIIFGYIVPCVILVWSYVKISMNSLIPIHQPVPQVHRNGVMMDAMNKRRALAEYWTSVLSMLSVLGFLIPWTPYTVISTMSIFMPLGVHTLTVPSMFAKLQPCFNPILYCFFNKPFVWALKKQFPFLKRKVAPATETRYQLERYKYPLCNPGVFRVTKSVSSSDGASEGHKTAANSLQCSLVTVEDAFLDIREIPFELKQCPDDSTAPPCRHREHAFTVQAIVSVEPQAHRDIETEIHTAESQHRSRQSETGPVMKRVVRNKDPSLVLDIGSLQRQQEPNVNRTEIRHSETPTSSAFNREGKQSCDQRYDVIANEYETKAELDTEERNRTRDDHISSTVPAEMRGKRRTERDRSSDTTSSTNLGLLSRRRARDSVRTTHRRLQRPLSRSRSEGRCDVTEETISDRIDTATIQFQTIALDHKKVIRFSRQASEDDIPDGGTQPAETHAKMKAQ